MIPKWFNLIVIAIAALYGQSHADLAPCARQEMELAICIDAGARVSANSWQQTKAFVVRLLQKYEIGNGLVRVAVVKYSSTATLVVSFSNSDSKAATLAQVAVMDREPYATRTHVALDYLRNKVFRRDLGSKSSVHKLAVIITEGITTEVEKVRGSTRLLKDMGVVVHVVGIGTGANMKLLQDIAYQPTPNYVHTASDYNVLLGMMDEVAKSICHAAGQVTGTLPPLTSDPCVDLEPDQCQGNNLCSDYKQFSMKNCRRFCGYCKPQVQSSCRDVRLDCMMYKSWICSTTETKYKEFARTNCASTCGFCNPGIVSTIGPTQALGPSKKPTCMDLINNCKDYGQLICTTADYAKWASAHCAQYCKMC